MAVDLKKSSDKSYKKEHHHGEVHGGEPSNIAMEYPTYQQNHTQYPPPSNPPPQQSLDVRATIVNSNNQAVKFHEIPVDCVCGYCHKYITTTTIFKTGTLTWIFCFVLLIFGCWLGCCLIPFACDSLKDVIHQCPSCGNKLQRYDRLHH